jgi:hypothetical protein
MSNGTKHLLRAFDGASRRLGEAVAALATSWPNEDATDTVFAPLGETLVWLVALDDLLLGVPMYEARRDNDPNGKLLPGLRLARNVIVRGVPVFGVVRRPRTEAATDGPIVFGKTGLGGDRFACAWAHRSGFPNGIRRRPAQESSYDANVMGRPLLEPLDRAMTFVKLEAT